MLYLALGLIISLLLSVYLSKYMCGMTEFGGIVARVDEVVRIPVSEECVRWQLSSELRAYCTSD